MSRLDVRREPGVRSRHEQASQGELGCPGSERNLEAGRQADASPKIDHLRAAGNRPSRGEAHVLEEVVVAQLVAVTWLSEERTQALERGWHALQDVGREPAGIEA